MPHHIQAPSEEAPRHGASRRLNPGFRFRFPSQTTIIGATQSGKTTLLRKIIENASRTFTDPIDNIFWFCGVRTPGIPAHLPNIRIFEGLPDAEMLKEYRNQRNIVVCDDLMTEFARSKDSLNLLNTLFTVYAHHYNCAVFNLVQSAFALPPVTRNNSTYLILMRSLSDAAQIKNLLVQQFGQKWRGAYEAYEDVMSKPYQAMMINNDPMSPANMRILSRFTDETPVAYEPV